MKWLIIILIWTQFVRITYCNDKILNNFLTKRERENKFCYVDIILEEFKNEKDVSICFKYPLQSTSSDHGQTDELFGAIRRIHTETQFTKSILNTIANQKIELFNTNIVFLTKPQEFL